MIVKTFPLHAWQSLHDHEGRRGGEPRPDSGYLERMARHKGQDSAKVTIGVKVSEADAAGIDEVLTRPEFAGWTRSEWCREIVRSALRFYVGDARAADADQARASARLATAPPAAPSQRPVPAHESVPESVPVPVPVLTAAGEPWSSAQDEPERADQPECSHPATARDYDTGTCAACGAVLWD
jgi:hypothetical protein